MEMDASLSSSQQERPIRFELVDDESTRTLVYSIDAAYQSFMMAVSGPTTLLPDAHGDRSTEAPHALFSLASRPSRVPHFIASPFKLHAMHMTGASSLSPDKAIEHLKNIVQCARQAILPNSKSLVDHPSGEYQNTQQLPEISPAVRASPFLGGYASGYNLTGNKHGSARHVRSTGGKFAGMRDLGTMVSGDFSDPGTPGWAGRESVAPSPHPDIEEHEHLYRLRSHDPDSDDEDADGIGTVINGYMIVGELGTGSFGRVVLAVHSETDEVVAIKIVRRSLLNRERRYAVTNHKHVFAASTTSEPAAPPAVQAAPASQHIIRKEIAVMKRLRHRHLVALRAVVDDPSADRLYLIMQYIPHGPFLPTLSGTSSMRVDPLPEKTARAYARQLISALRHLHANNIVHRDVKPENILKGDEDRIYLADFGVSEIVDDLKLNRNVVGTRGTPSFWSPEMFDEKETTVDGVRQDEWALAVTIYLMLVGRLPFEARSLQDLAFSVRNDPVLIPDTLSPEARDFLRRALMKNKSDRLSLSEMREHHFVRGHVSRQRRNLENARAAAGRIHGGGEKGGAATPVLASLKDDSAILEAAVVEAAVVRPTLLVVNTPGQGSSPLETSSSTPPHLDLSRNPGDKPAPANNNSHLTVKSSFRHLSAAVAANGQLLTPNSSRVVARLALRERPLPPEEDAWERDSLSGDEDNAEEDSGGSADFGAAYSEPSPPRERRASVGRASTMQYKKSPRAILPGPLMENNNNDAANHSTGSSEETQTPLQRVGSYSVTTSLKQEAEIARRRKAAS